MSNVLSPVPVGTIFAMLCASNAPPTGWLFCDGSVINANTYPALAPLLTNNTLPDLRDRALVGAGKNYSLRSSMGVSSVTLQESQMPCHQHYGWGEASTYKVGLGYGTTLGTGYTGSKSTDGDNYLFGSTWAGGNGAKNIEVIWPNSNKSATSSSYSSNDPFSIVQPSYAINFFIFAGW